MKSSKNILPGKISSSEMFENKRSKSKILCTVLIATYFMATSLEDWQAGKQKDNFHRALKVTVLLQHAHIFCYFGQMFFFYSFFFSYDPLVRARQQLVLFNHKIPTSLPNLKNVGAVLTMYVYVFLCLLLIFWSPPWKAGRLGNRRIFFTEPLK